MSVIATFNLDSEGFPLGESIGDQSSARIEIERVVPAREEQFPFVFVWEHTDYAAFERTTRSQPEIQSVTLLETFDDGRLYKLDWAEGLCPLVSEIVDNEGMILSATGTPTTWMFELRFPDHGNVSSFFREVADESTVDLSLKSLVREVDFESSDRAVLTPKQHRALETAFQMGYFEVPRKAHLDDVADALDLSSSATSALLRRGCNHVFEREFN